MRQYTLTHPDNTFGIPLGIGILLYWEDYIEAIYIYIFTHTGNTFRVPPGIGILVQY